MSTPGIADPYWYEWYVGLDNIIKMLNPDNGIDYVIFQSEDYDTIDDVVVGYKNGTQEVCYQVKHEILSDTRHNLTFGNLIKPSPNKKEGLFCALIQGWQKANTLSGQYKTPVLYTNRAIGSNRTRRIFHGKAYQAYPLDDFFIKIIKQISDQGGNLSLHTFDDINLSMQWAELCESAQPIKQKDIIEFIKAFDIRANQLSLEESESEIINSISQTFDCSESLARELFVKLAAQMRIWATTRRPSEKISIEDVYDVLGTENDVLPSQHRLIPPSPFFSSRQSFCSQLVQDLKATDKKVVFISGEPGCGKTSIISYLQSKYNLFSLRFHTFKPISPNQHFYGLDEGMCSPENLWGTMLIQLRANFKGRLEQCHVPLNNKFCSTAELRQHVCRLLGILGSEALEKSEKVLVCIDGIDHAARAKGHVTFLHSLYIPEEVPAGVCIVIVGQPADLYQAQYPSWLYTSDSVMRINVPPLCLVDIQQLIEERTPQFSDEKVGLSELIYHYTLGNNLSTVFAIEELVSTASYEDAVTHLQESGISHDIQQYYQHIWNYVRQELSEMGLGIPFPESIVACPLLLMNGRVKTSILENALSYHLTNSDWCQIFNRLYPLVYRCENDGEYAIFHNDFRVFLMGIINNYLPKYREIALQLAQYFIENNEEQMRYIIAIPLLCSAERKDLIPEIFTPEFVIGALAERISKRKLSEFAQLAYNEACLTKNIDQYITVYLSIQTLYQHERYYEYYDRQYIAIHDPDLETIDISEIRVLPLTKENIDQYNSTLNLCLRLYNNPDSDTSYRANILYKKWFGLLTPADFLFAADHEEENDRLILSNIRPLLEQWGLVAATLSQPVPQYESSTTPTDETDELDLYFGDSYFENSFQQNKYIQASEALDKGYVSTSCFSKNLGSILYSKQVKLFHPYILAASRKADELLTKLFAKVILSFNDCLTSPIEEDITFPDIHKVYDDTSLTLILYSFLVGYNEAGQDEINICNHLRPVLNRLDESPEALNQISWMMRLACILGKWQAQQQPFISDGLRKHVFLFLSQKPFRFFEYSKARTFLLFAILNGNAHNILVEQGDLLSLLDRALEQANLLSFDWEKQASILKFFQQYGEIKAIKRHILRVYGEDGLALFEGCEYSKEHEIFCRYGNIVFPKMMNSVSEKIKWDVVGYVDHKEYSLQGPLDSFSTIVNLNSAEWEKYGKKLYQISRIANDKGDNRFAYTVEEAIATSAAKNGLDGSWKLHFWSKNFQMNPKLLVVSVRKLLSKAKTEVDFVSLWLLICGIHSWYLQDDHLAMSDVYKDFVDAGILLNINTIELISTLTPEWFSILQQNKESMHQSQSQSYESEYKLELTEKLAVYQTMSTNELFTALIPASLQTSAANHIIEIVKRLQEKSALDQTGYEQVLRAVCTALQERTWHYNGFTELMSILLDNLHDEAFWSFAHVIGENLLDYAYELSAFNMQFLLNLYLSHDLEKITEFFNRQVCVQKLWITGDNHFGQCDDNKTISPWITTPTSFSEMALYILLEQIESHNLRKIESAVYSIYSLGNNCPETITSLIACWDTLTVLQKRFILYAIYRWFIEKRIEGLSCLFEVILGDYEECNSLNQKYLLHSVLNAYGTDVVCRESLDCTAHPFQYQPIVASLRNNSILYNRFLNLVDHHFHDKTFNNNVRAAIARYTSQDASIPKDEFSKPCDLSIMDPDIIGDQILYGEEAKGRWSDIPLIEKKCWLLPADDPFMLTEIPRMIYDSGLVSDIENIIKSFLTISETTLSQTIRKFLDENETIVGAFLWCPLKENQEFWFYDVAEILPKTVLSPQHSTNIPCALGSFGLLGQTYSENLPDVLALPLFSKIVGDIYFLNGYSQITPSNVWRDIFNCRPTSTSPYLWQNENGKVVLRYERLALPIQDIHQERYYSQPIICRWLCDSEWLKSQLEELELRMRFLRKKEINKNE